MSAKPPALLCLCNVPSTTGYAWTFIGRLYAQLADHLATHGIRTLVAYTSMPAPPPSLAGSAAEAVVLGGSHEKFPSLGRMVRLIRSENVRVVYFTDRAMRSWRYQVLRSAGLRRIIVHDHTSGERTRPRGLKRLAKYVLARVPGMIPDAVIGVSDFVVRRDLEVALLPHDRVFRVWNGMALPPDSNPHSSASPGASLDRAPFRAYGIGPERFHIVCACRAVPEKGVAHLLRAFDRMMAELPSGATRPALIYFGGGPDWDALRALRESLAAKDSIFFAGEVPNAKPAVAAADLCVVPSVWQDAFPLSVLEPMSFGKPVIASRVGGIPEMVEDKVTGIIVPPGDEAALAQALRELVTDPAAARRFGEAGRRRVAQCFSLEAQIAQLIRLVEAGFELGCYARRLQSAPHAGQS